MIVSWRGFRDEHGVSWRRFRDEHGVVHLHTSGQPCMACENLFEGPSVISLTWDHTDATPTCLMCVGRRGRAR